MENSVFSGRKGRADECCPAGFFLAAIWFWVSIRLQVLFQGET